MQLEVPESLSRVLIEGLMATFVSVLVPSERRDTTVGQGLFLYHYEGVDRQHSCHDKSHVSQVSSGQDDAKVAKLFGNDLVLHAVESE